MNKKNLIIIAGLLLIAGLIFSLPYISSRIRGLRTPQRPQVASPTNTNPDARDQGDPSAQSRETKQGQQENQEVSTVEIPAEKQQLIGVKTTTVTVKPLKKTIRTVGRIEYDERRVSTVNTKVEGWIEKLYIDYAGKHVSKGEPLAEIYSQELYATQHELISLSQWWRDVRAGDNIGWMLANDVGSMLEAARQRLRLWDITDDQIKKIEETGKQIKTLTIYSPVSGYVAEKTVYQGAKVTPGAKLFTVADLSYIWILSDIYEFELPFVKTGQEAKISLSYFPGKEFISRVDYTYPALSGETRTAKIRFTIPNPGMQLKPQMFTNVELKVDLGKRLVVPDDAVIDTGMRQVVYVDRGEGNFEPREIEVGLKADGLTEILKGLKAGEKVASSATFLIDSEAQLKGVTPLHKH